MPIKRSFAFNILFSFAILLLLISSTESKIKSVKVKSKSSIVKISETMKFTADVKRTNKTSKAVTWSISGLKGIDNGTIDENGNYTAPSAITYTTVITDELGISSTITAHAVDVKVKATSVANKSKSSVKKTTVYSPPAVLNVSIKPKEFNILYKKKKLLKLSVSKRGSGVSSDVTWHLFVKGKEVENGSTAGKIIKSGKKFYYKAPSSSPGGIVYIVAKSTFDKTRTGYASTSVTKKAPKLKISGTAPFMDFGTVTIGETDNVITRIFTLDSSTGISYGWQIARIPNWLSIDPLSGTTPETLTLTLGNTSTLQPGQNIGKIVLKSTRSGVKSAIIKVYINAVDSTY